MNILTNAVSYDFGMSPFKNLKNQVTKGLISSAATLKTFRENYSTQDYQYVQSIDPLEYVNYNGIDLTTHIQANINNNKPDCLMPDSINEFATVRVTDGKIEVLGIDISW